MMQTTDMSFFYFDPCLVPCPILTPMHMHMYACMHMYMYMYIYMYMHIYMHIYIYIYMGMYIYRYIHSAHTHARVPFGQGHSIAQVRQGPLLVHIFSCTWIYTYT
jgi:hypothetical protein